MNILEKIVEDKRLEVAQRKLDFPCSEFESGLLPNDRNFKQALIDDRATKGAAYIFECKKASPSKGLIRENFDLDEICDAYSKYASCVSVLTDEKYFQGEFERLPQVKEKLKQPILCKDFFVDEYQVKLARRYGANAVLLMLSVLDDTEYERLRALTDKLDMSVLTEVSNEEEMIRAVRLKADIIGINNRNLRDLSTDLEQTPKLVEKFLSIAAEEQIEDTVIISESGIYNHDQIKKLNKHAHGYLVGSSLMAQDDLQRACKQLVKGEHKVCGLTSAKAILDVAEAGADYAGIILVPKSKRYVEPKLAEAILEQVTNTSSIKCVAVVQDHSISRLVELLSQLPFAAVQLHGDEDQSYIDELKKHITKLNLNTEVWKVVHLEPNGQLPSRWPCADKILLDTQVNGQKGGTGESFNWQLLNNLPLNLPPVMLAGGLNPKNAKLAWQFPVNGLDFNSGVEVMPGVKDKKLVHSAFKALQL